MRKTVCKRLWKFAALVNPDPSRLIRVPNLKKKTQTGTRLEWRGFKGIYRGLKKRYARFPERRAMVPK